VCIPALRYYQNILELYTDNVLQFTHMESSPREINWKALEHHHFEKTIEWYIILAIFTVAFAFSAFYLHNFLLGVLIVIAGIALAVAATRAPRELTHVVSVRGIKVGHTFYPFTELESYNIDEEHRHGPHLLVVTKHKFSPMLVIPIPEHLIDDIEDIVAERISEEDLDEPFFNILLEILRF